MKLLSRLSLFFLSFLTVTVVMLGFRPEPDKDLTPLPQSYCNPRFGYCFTYDKAIFNTIPDGINGDGITITDKTGTVTLDSYGSFNPYHLTVDTLLHQNLEYLLRTHAAKPRSVSRQKDTFSYVLHIETDDTYIKQELILDGFYYKVLTVEVSRAKKRLVKHIMESTYFEQNAAMVAR